MFPFENVPVTEGSSTLLVGKTAQSTPTGAVATIVSATRANQMVNVRMRLEAEPGAAPSLGGSYFEHENVFLFDPVSKRKYAMVRPEGPTRTTRRFPNSAQHPSRMARRTALRRCPRGDQN